MSKALGIAGPKIVKFEARQIVQTLAKFTPPKTLAQGRKAVARDILRSVSIADLPDFRNPRIAELIRAGDKPAIQEIFNNSKNRKKWRVVDFSPSLHTSARDKRGHVRNQKNLMTLDAAKEKRYIKDMQKRVGTAKGSWGKAADAVEAKLPAWARKAAGFGVDKINVQDNISDQKNPRITITNSNKGVVNTPNMDAIAKRTVKARQIAMIPKTARMLSDPAKYPNLYAQYQ
jgi:hypothetical protein